MIGQGILKYLALVASTSTAADGTPTQYLERVPENVIESAIDDVLLEPRWNEPDRLALLRLLASEERESLQARLVHTFAESRSEKLEAALDRLANDRLEVVRHMATEVLRLRLTNAKDAEKLAIASDWALAPVAGKRLALSRVLSDTRLPYEDLMLDLLLEDNARSVREAAFYALERRLLEGKDAPALLSLVERQAYQQDRSLRKRARKLMVGAATAAAPAA
jgi:hypothetical protein